MPELRRTNPYVGDLTAVTDVEARRDQGEAFTSGSRERSQAPAQGAARRRSGQRIDPARLDAARRHVERFLDDPESGVEAVAFAGSVKSQRLRLFLHPRTNPLVLPRWVEGLRIELLQTMRAWSCGLQGGRGVRHDRSGMAGTLTSVVWNVERSQRMLLLSGHVVNRWNEGRVGDTLSVGADGFLLPARDTVETFRLCGYVSKLVTLNLNDIDAWHSHEAALAIPCNGVDLLPGLPFGRLEGVRYPTWGEHVTMIGASSGRTYGRITGAGRVTVSFDAEDSRWAVFHPVLLASPELASDGDSGSLVVCGRGDRWCAVGMLIARNDLFTVITLMQHIYGALGVRLQ